MKKLVTSKQIWGGGGNAINRRIRKYLSFLLIISIVMSLNYTGTVSMAANADKKEETADTKTKGVTVIDVTDFGADPSGRSDSEIAVKKAIEAAKKVTGPVTINFPKGEYQFYPDYAEERELYISNTVGADTAYNMKKIGILLENMQDVTIEGNGSTFMFHGKMITFATIESKNIVFQNFKVNFSSPTVIDITVEDKTENSATIFIPECYDYDIDGKDITWLGDISPYTGTRYWSGKNGLRYAQAIDLNTGITNRLSLPLFNGVKDIEELGNNRIKINYTATTPTSIKPGICYQIRNTVRDHSGTFFWNSEDVTAKNLDVQYIHGFGMVGQTSTNITLDTINFLTPEGSGRTTAGYADFIQMSGCKGLIKVVNSTFSNPHDDPINIHGTFLQVSERISNRQFKVQYKHNETAGFPSFFVGDEVEFMTKGNMIPVENSVAKVVAVEGPTSEDLTSIIITLDKDMPMEIGENTHVVENITYTPSVEIRNNVFKETPTRGILVTTRKPVVIEDNTFDGMSMSGIYISNDAQGWYESGPVKDVLIQNNTFTRCASPVIYIEPTNPTVSTDKTVHKNIRILNNEFYIKDSQVLNAKSVDGLTFADNIVNRYRPEIELSLISDKGTLNIGEIAKLTANASGKTLDSNLFSFNGCKNVLLENNQYDGGLRVNASIYNMLSEDVTIGALEKVVVNGAANNTPPIGKIFYTSSNEAVAKVSKSGNIEAIAEGTVDIGAYTIINGRKFESVPLKITVANSGVAQPYPTDITISAAGSNVLTSIGETRSFTAQLTPAAGVADTVTWSVKDPITGIASDKATIADGILTAAAPGVVEVSAVTENGLMDSKVMVIAVPSESLSKDYTVYNPLEGGWQFVGNDIEIAAKGGSLWATGTAKNVIVKNCTEDLTNVTAIVKVTGATQKLWEEAGLIFYKDNDNYAAVQQKHAGGNPGFMVTNEVGGSPSEQGVANTVSTEYYYKLVKAGDSITGYYSIDNTNWIKVREVANSALGSDFKIGIIAGGSESDPFTKFTFSNLTINEVNYPFKSVNTSPSVSNVLAVASPGAITANYTFADMDGDTEGRSIIKWSSSKSQNGNYRVVDGLEGKTVTVPEELNGHYLKPMVIPFDERGAIGNSYESLAGVLANSITEPDWDAMPSSESYLSQASFTNTSFGVFDKKTYSYFTKIEDAEISSTTFSLEAQDKDAAVQVIHNNKQVQNGKGKTSGNVSLVSGINVIEVIVTAQDGVSNTIYRYVIMRTGFNNARLANIKVNGTTIKDFNPDNLEYEYILNDTSIESVTISAATESNSAKTAITSGKNRTEGKEAICNVTPGVNTVVISSYPDTSAAPKYYTIKVRIPNAENTNLEEMNFSTGVKLEQAFSPDQTMYTGKTVASSTTLSLKAEEKDAKIQVKYANYVYNSKNNELNQRIDFHKGINKLTIFVISAKGEKKSYEVEIEANSVVYLSDMDYEANSFTGWGAIQKDKEVEGIPITLLGDDGIVEFKKGVGAHATSELYYNLENYTFDTFTTYVGVDASMKGRGSISFEIFADGVSVFKTEEMTSADQMQWVELPITGVKHLKLVADEGDNNGSDHADYADAKLTMNLPDAPLPDEPEIDLGDGSVPGGKTEAQKVNEIVSEIKAAKDNEEVTIDLTQNGGKLANRILKEAKGKNVNLVIEVDFITWYINGKDIKTISDNVNTINLLSKKLQNDTVLKGADVMQLELASLENLPFDAKIKINVGAQYEGKRLFLNIYNKEQKELEFVSFDKADDKGFGVFELSKGGKYALMTSCGYVENPVKEIKGNSKVSVEVGKKITLEAEVSPAKATLDVLEWKSSNSKWAAVDENGVVTPKKAALGKTVTITAASLDGKGAKKTYKVYIGTPVTKIVISSKTKTLEIGKPVKLTCQTTPKNATNSSVTWKVSNTKYAAIKADGTITAKKAGKGKTITIRATAKDNQGATKTIKLKIK